MPFSKSEIMETRRLVSILLLCFSCVLAMPLLAVEAQTASDNSAATSANESGSSLQKGSSSTSTSSSRRPKIGLALAGGGTRGCAHIGVLRVLQEEGIPVDCIAGTSIGAIVGGLYASGRSVDDLADMVSSPKMMKAFNTVPIPVRIALVPVFLVAHMLGWHPLDGLYRGNKFRKFISDCAPPEHRLIENFPIPFAAVAANLLDGKAYAIRSGDIGKAAQASSAIPFLRRPVEIGDKLFVDGGIVDNLPCDETRQLGADFVIAVDIDDDLKVLNKTDFHKIGSAADRAINMHLSAVDSFQLGKADFVIHPDVTGIALLDGKKKDALAALKAGEDAARQCLPSLRQKLRERAISVAGTTLNKSSEKVNDE